MLRRARQLLTGTLLLLAFVLAACDLSSGSGGSPTATNNVHLTPTSSGILLGAQTCPDVVKDPAHWNAVVGLSSGQTAESVICGNLMGIPALQAVVTVRHSGSDRMLDIAIYNNITASSPTQVFALRGLLHGDARISGYNTLLTGQADPHSRLNKGLPSSELQQDLYREFKWSDSARTFVQIAFPGIFPDLTRFQAEFVQQDVNQGQGFQQWRLDVVKSAQTFANSLLNWPANAPVTVLSGGGAHDTKAIVQVQKTASGGGMIRISFSRLELNANGGIWEATAVETNGMSITAPQSEQVVTNPITVTGRGMAFEGTVGTLKALDNQYTNIGQVDARGASFNGKTAFSSMLPYSSSFHGGMQEGVVALYAYSTTDHSIVGAVMVKVLLSG